MNGVRLTLMRFVRERFAAVVLAGVMLVPAIYGGLLVWGYWDPYVRSSQIPAAIVNLDQPVSINGQEVTAGKELTDLILKSDTMVWAQTNADSAEQGLQDKTFYATLTIPADFSKKMTSVTSAAPQQARLQVRTNDAGNFLVGVLAKDAVAAVQGMADETLQANYLDVVYDGLQAADKGLDTASEGAQALAQGTDAAATGSGYIAAGTDTLNHAVQTVTDVARQLDDEVDGLPEQADQLAATANSISADAATVESASSGVLSQLNAIAGQLSAAGHPDMANTVNAAASTFQNAVESKTQSIATQAATAASGATALGQATAGAVDATGQLSAASDALNAGAQDLHTALSQALAPGAKQLADGLATAANTDIAITDAPRETFAKVLAQPVVIDTVDENRVAHFGDGFTPYFGPMGLFVGAVFVFLVLSPLDRRLQLWGGSAFAAAATPLAAAAVIVVLQALLLFGALLLTGVRPANWAALLGVMAISAISYAALMQALKAALGLIGEFIGVVILVLQVAAGEGAYPIQTFGTFFQAVNPFLPMTYTNDGVRRAIAGGPLSQYLWIDVAVLAGVAAVAFGCSMWAAKRHRMFTVAGLRPTIELV